MSTRLFCKRIGCAMVIGVLSSTSATLGNESTKSASLHQLMFTGKSSRLGAIDLEVQFEKLHDFKEAPTVRKWGWGCGDPHDIAIRSLKLSIGKIHIKVPPQAYANLLNIIPATISLRETQDRLFLYMTGGDGAETY